MKTTKLKNGPVSAGSLKRRALPLGGVATCVALAFASPAFGATEIELLKQELQKQRDLLEMQQRKLEALEKQSAMQSAKIEQAVPVAKSADKPLVTFYGILDGGVEHLNNIGSNKDSETHSVSVTGTVPSRVGVKLNKSFGDGYAAIATLEAGFNFDDGSQG